MVHFGRIAGWGALGAKTGGECKNPPGLWTRGILASCGLWRPASFVVAITVGRLAPGSTRHESESKEPPPVLAPYIMPASRTLAGCISHGV